MGGCQYIRMSKYLVLDYYVDEPSCLGVPPYISPYVRYLYGAIKTSKKAVQIDYLTIDELRQQKFKLFDEYTLIFIVAGSTVPGKYLAGNIGSYAEIIKFVKNNPHAVNRTVAGGPIQYLSQSLIDKLEAQGVFIIKKDIEMFAYEYLTQQHIVGKIIDTSAQKKRYNRIKLLRKFSVNGAEVIRKHFRFPYVVLEIETYMGCTRSSYCSFCTEAFYGKPVFRDVKDILEEVKALYQTGGLYFRLGRQADLFTFQANLSVRRNGFPLPNVKAIEKLYVGIREVAPNLKVLHLDNTNPGGIANFPEESIEIVKIIQLNNTTLDTAAMGVETFDDDVVQLNNLKATAEESRKAIQLVHEYGAVNKNGLPALAPGINLLGGLIGETEKTFEMNFMHLKKILDEKIILRRINIRTVVSYEDTRFSTLKKNQKNKVNKKRLTEKFDYFKKKIRNEIDSKMLALTFPKGSIIKEVIIEKEVPHGYLGRPLGSYPITCHILRHKFTVQKNAIKDLFPPYEMTDVIIIGYKERTVYAISVEEDFRSLPIHILKKIVPNDLAHNIWSNGIDSYINFIPDYLKDIL